MGLQFARNFFNSVSAVVKTIIRTSIYSLLLLQLFFMQACTDKNDFSDADVDKAVEDTQAHVNSFLRSTGIVTETDSGSTGVRMDIDGGIGLMGSNLDIPAWIPKEFPLPEDLAIYVAVEEKNGDKNLAGNSQTVSREAYQPRIVAWAEERGKEVIDRGSRRITVVYSDDEVIDVDIENGLGITLTVSNRSVAHDRQSVAPEIISSGLAHIEMAGKSWDLAGNCTIKGTSYNFEHNAPDSSTVANFTIQSAHEAPQGSAMFMTFGSNGVATFSINFPTGSENEPEIATAETKFSVRGEFGGMSSADGRWVNGIISVDCGDI
jgi:hypothetical protein